MSDPILSGMLAAARIRTAQEIRAHDSAIRTLAMIRTLERH